MKSLSCSRGMFAFLVVVLLSGSTLVMSAEPAHACENFVGVGSVQASYHVDEPALAPYDACVSVNVGVPVVGTGVSASVNVTSPTLLYDYVEGGGAVCQVTFCVLAGASAGVNDAPFVGACYIDVNQAICVP